jgi:hypothetical protein
MREEPDLNRENNENRKTLSQLLKCRGRYWKPAVKFEGNPEKPDLNGEGHKSRWHNYRGSLHLHGDEMRTPK